MTAFSLCGRSLELSNPNYVHIKAGTTAVFTAVCTKMYRLGGETDFASYEEKELVRRRREVQRKQVVKNFSQTFVKNIFYFL